MNAGHALDALVAEKVFGWREIPCERPPNYWRDSRDWLYLIVPEFSTDLTEAWKVVEKFDAYEVRRYYDPGQGPTGGDFFFKVHVTGFKPERFGRGTAETAPEAICLAALKAVGVEP